MIIADPQSETEPEYYPVGHDSAEPDAEKRMLALKQSLSWLFAGIGDARNLFSTLIFLEGESLHHGTHESNWFHLTLIDLKPAAMAKILIMLHLLEQSEDMEAVACTVYVHGSLIMPSFAYTRLQQTIADLIDRYRQALQTQVPGAQRRLPQQSSICTSVLRHW